MGKVLGNETERGQFEKSYILNVYAEYRSKCVETHTKEFNESRNTDNPSTINFLLIRKA